MEGPEEYSYLNNRMVLESSYLAVSAEAPSQATHPFLNTHPVQMAVPHPVDPRPNLLATLGLQCLCRFPSVLVRLL